jgi:hypothetical protein
MCTSQNVIDGILISNKLGFFCPFLLFIVFVVDVEINALLLGIYVYFFNFKAELDLGYFLTSDFSYTIC